MSALLAHDPVAYPSLAEGLEEVRACIPRDMAAAVAFALSRLPPQDRRGVALAATGAWAGEHGRPHGPGLAGCGLGARREGMLLIAGRTEAEMLWAMEQALLSGAVSAVLGTIEGATLAQTRRLAFAARDGEAVGVLLRVKEGGLSAARRRWTITTQASRMDGDDARAPGRFRLSASLTRSRDERPGQWMLEQDDETDRLRLADRLADDGSGERGQRHAA